MWPHTDFPRQKLFPSIVDMLLTGEDVEFQAALPASHRVGCSAEPITGAAVPELTRSAGIKLNERLSLRRHRSQFYRPRSRAGMAADVPYAQAITHPARSGVAAF
jgi:hypothetical protein